MINIKLRNRRKKMNLTYKDVAIASELSVPGYWQIENGKRGCSYERAVQIALALKTTPDAIFLEKELTKTEQGVTE
ncbi:helix-turn-helix domain-containing protein [Liquorilactobacillus nagelii]|uniref:helix-turn-helix domain-containing protein n=1 Tax=Liquorilactobacillus nagelii TaxID=82688 RepID=UPI0039E75696